MLLGGLELSCWFCIELGWGFGVREEEGERTGICGEVLMGSLGVLGFGEVWRMVCVLVVKEK